LQAIEQQNGGDYVDYLLNGPVGESRANFNN
jgi:hypothetical protein